MRDYTETDGTVPQTEEFLGDQANKGSRSLLTPAYSQCIGKLEWFSPNQVGLKLPSGIGWANIVSAESFPFWERHTRAASRAAAAGALLEVLKSLQQEPGVVGAKKEAHLQGTAIEPRALRMR
jgi:hypothetical protein